MSLFKECENMPNKSPGLLKLLKKKPTSRIWAMSESNTASGFVSLKKLKDIPLKDLELKIGMPSSMGVDLKYSGDHKIVKAKSFYGNSIRGHMFMGRNRGEHVLAGIGHKSTGTWMIDVTERFVKEINEIGACSVSRAHCIYELISPRIKECKFCKDRLYRRIETVKNVNWESK